MGIFFFFCHVTVIRLYFAWTIIIFICNVIICFLLIFSNTIFSCKSRVYSVYLISA